jgi:hypothetical protein
MSSKCGKIISDFNTLLEQPIFPKRCAVQKPFLNSVFLRKQEKGIQDKEVTRVTKLTRLTRLTRVTGLTKLTRVISAYSDW